MLVNRNAILVDKAKFLLNYYAFVKLHNEYVSSLPHLDEMESLQIFEHRSDDKLSDKVERISTEPEKNI